jgi:Gas vesicle synthesis protein GvpO
VTDGKRSDSLSALEVVEQAKQAVAQLTGRRPETVSGFETTDEGWRVTVEVVELERIPPSTSLLASYETLLDRDGNLIEYRRIRRYSQGQSDPDSDGA